MNNWIIDEPFMSDDGLVFVRLECPWCGWSVKHEALSKEDIGFWNYCPKCGKHNHERELKEETNA